jgi:Ni/Fe-hydrogenase subunit HybB-like protein
MANVADAAPERFIGASESFASVGLDVAGIAFGHPLRLRWWLAFAAAVGLLGVLAVSLGFILYEGVGVWGNNIPVTWALDIVSYDWWIGIASGGLLISAMLMLFGTEWRGALNRLTETGALIAAAAAAVYPIIHLGRPWYFYWNLPYPNTLLLWPQFRSPLYWDAIDIISYLVVALTFWTLGLLPDLATLRDRAIERWRETGRGKYRAYLYGIFALGWRGSARHWDRWLQAYRIVAVTGVLLVFSLQTGAAVMFAGTVEPGWHDPLLPFAYVATAIFSGVAFMAAAAVVLRWIFRLEGMITDAHLKVMAMLLLVLGLVNLYCYANEFFTTLLGNDRFETGVLGRRFAGPHAWALWDFALLALLPIHVFWFRAVRRSGLAVFLVGTAVSIGIFGDHFMEIVTTLQQDFLPSVAHPFSVNLWGVATFIGSSGLFFTLVLLALRYLPVVSIVEVRRLSLLGAELQPEPDSGRTGHVVG